VWLRYDMLHLWQVEDIYGGRAAALVNTYMLVLLPLLGWLAGVLLFFSHQRYQQQLQQAQLLLHQAKSARLKILRYQLDPHFMFNTLNALNALIVSRDDAQIERLIDNLSVFLRHSLHEHPRQQVPLTQELAALQAYLIIQQLRFGERLQLRWQQASLPPLQLPPLLLQPLAEFSIQQGVTTQTGLLQLQFDIQLQPPWLRLQFISGVRTDVATDHATNIATGIATCSATGIAAEPTLITMPPAQWPEALQQLNERLILLFGYPSQLYVQHGDGVFKSGFYLPMEALDVRT
jgi:LytS/YehU family sensor histidine kinase